MHEQPVVIPLAAGDSAPRLVVRVRHRVVFALLAANATGALVTFALGIFVVPAPEANFTGENIVANAIAFTLVLAAGGPAGIYFSTRAARDAQRWMLEDRRPSPHELAATLSFPLRQTLIEAALWLLAAFTFFFVNLSESLTLATEAGTQTVLGGLTTCALTYLLLERLSRPTIARALQFEAPDSPAGLAIGRRFVLTWLFSCGVPLVAAALTGLVVLSDEVHASPERVGVAVAVVAAVGCMVGLAAAAIQARLLSEPLRGLRTAVGRVEAGELDVEVPVDDAGELGVLQAGFNRMAHGLRERERLRDLFGRHVGEDVARAALERDDVELGGELRDAAVLFVDVIGSTRLAATHDPREVVERLNAFFAIVVDTVSLHGGWVNKFEGDAALCVFGAPAPHPDPAGAALATARAMRFRLDDQLRGLEAAIGVSAGEVVAGNVGAANRFEYTVIGDPVNEAARLSELAKASPERLLASDAALARAGDRERGRWRFGREESLRGRTKPTRIASPR